MKHRTLGALAAMLVVFGSVPATAADSADSMPAPIVMEDLAARLDLTADQQARIAPALQKRNEGLKALAGDLDGEASRRQKLKAAREGRAIQQEFVGKVTPVLTKEQQATWEKMRHETRAQLSERRQRRQP